MKKLIAACFCLCLCFTAFGASFMDIAAAETTGTEVSAAEMTPEELYQTGRAAFDAEDYGKAMEYFQLAADAGNAEGWRGIGNLYADGFGVEQDSGRALECYQLAAELGDAQAYYNIGKVNKYVMGEDKETGKAVEYYQKNSALDFEGA